MNAAHVSEAISALDGAKQYIEGNIEPGASGRADLIQRLFMASLRLKTELSVIPVQVTEE